ILLEDGRPLLFGHRRQGRDGKLFRCWKFRTMQRNAEKIVRDLNDLNLADGPQVMIPNDPRVTRLGRFLRAANLDEIPQFWNVLVGQMSLVGPRPSPDDENQYCPAWRDLRLSVRPGITGLWQLKRTRGRGEDFQEWIKYDIQYVQAANFWFDMFILTRTAWLMLTRRRVSGPK
ncbi:MAG: sugar transferase, partial [Phycisphaerales bacterium]|nr:sugar transferase [Phycisphaerales bacterium]